MTHMNPDEFRREGHRLVDWIADYMRRVEDLPVLSRAQPGDILDAIPAHPPQTPMADSQDSWDRVFEDLDSIIMPGITHWQSPRFFGYFPCNATGPSILGELLSAGLGVQGMLWQTSPAVTELEIRMLDWMAECLDLPERFRSTSGGGVIQGTASESTLVAMVAARARAPEGDLVAYSSTQAHSSVRKAAMICGVCHGLDDHVHLRLIDTDDTLAMDPDALARAIDEDVQAGRVPFFVCATVGTTSTTAVDPLGPIARAIGDSGAWLHVDAAHAGAACVCPEHRWMLDGVEHADSICFNPHKWLLTSFDCDCFWTADRESLLAALSITPEYLRNQASETGQVVDYRDWQIPLGRRFRALKMWFVMRHYGIEGMRSHIRHGVSLAAHLEACIAADERFEIVAKRTINLVCFRLRAGDDATRALLDRVNAGGHAFLTHTVIPRDGQDIVVLRMAVGAVPTERRHVDEAWSLITEQAACVLDG